MKDFNWSQLKQGALDALQIGVSVRGELTGKSKKGRKIFNLKKVSDLLESNTIEEQESNWDEPVKTKKKIL